MTHTPAADDPGGRLPTLICKTCGERDFTKSTLCRGKPCYWTSPDDPAPVDWLKLDELRAKAAEGPWCYESCGEKGDGANVIGVAFSLDDTDCKQPLHGKLPPFDKAGNEIQYYRDEEVAVCEHRNRNSATNAAFIVALVNSYPAIRSMAGGEGRTPSDFAIEFGEYLAKAVEAFMGFLNANGAAAKISDQDGLTDHWRGLESAVYEFRKRAARAASLPKPAGP